MEASEVPAESVLEMAERHVREGEEHIAKQKALIAKLEADGNAGFLPSAREFLALLEQTQATHLEHAAMERKAAG